MVNDPSLCHSRWERATKIALISEDTILVANNTRYFDLVRTWSLGEQWFLAETLETSFNNDRLVHWSGLVQSLLSDPFKAPSLSWLFTFDVLLEPCYLRQFQAVHYCSRLARLKNIVVARVHSNSNDGGLIFLQRIFDPSRNHNLSVQPLFVLAQDYDNFFEFKSLIKHLDSYGRISSVTFEQNNNRFATTHFGREAQVCLTQSILIAKQGETFSIS